MPTRPAKGLVVYRARVGIDAIDQYSRRLVDALIASGLEACYVPEGAAAALREAAAPAWVLLQYNPFAYGRAGFAPGLLRDVRRMRRRSRAPLVVMVHEAWVDVTDPKSSLVGLWQRAQLRALLRFADGVMTSTEALAQELGHGAVHVPMATNIAPVASSHEAARTRLGLDGKLAIALFGRANPGRALDHAEAAIEALAGAHGVDRLAILNLGAGAPAVRVPAGVEVHRPGELPPGEVSLRLWASDLVLLPFTDGVSTRRGTLMAALAHGRPVLGCTGAGTDAVLAQARDALALTPVGDTSAFARAAVELTTDPRRLVAIGEAGRRLYASRFDWPVVTDQVANELEKISPADSRGRIKPRRVVFVAHEVGGSGGMERQSEHLVGGLLARGREVTVISRSCSLPKTDGLRFVRVPTPRRPASLGYPAFFAVASVFAARQGDSLLHTTGAILANRADISTVHYCHRAASTQVIGSRASKPGALYRLNSAVNGILSVVGEAWCYRPARTRLLCAVSGGVAGELRDRFPTMADAVRTVPNGVDSAVFCPNPDARRNVRADLGLADGDRLALFVGGDWGRKGLRHAVEALAHAPGWHLVVAGAGDPTLHLVRSRRAGTASRLHFLGRVHDMPRLYSAGDAFVLPTAYEAFPLVALEAAASGVPLLVTRVNGIEDLIEDGLGGWFIAHDSSDIASRLRQLGSDSELARRMAAAARASARRFSWEAMTDGYLSLYAELQTPLTAREAQVLEEPTVLE